MRDRDYADLKILACVADRGSFRAASAELGLSPSALSQIIRDLEERLGVRLLHRTTRSLSLSEAGGQLLQRVRPLIEAFDAAMADLADQKEEVSGRLRLNATRIAGLGLLSPIIGPFCHAYPEVVLDISLDERLVDIVGEGFDAGIRLGERLEQDMVAVRLGGPLRMICVASPDYLARKPRPQRPQDLKQHQCLNYRWPTSGALYSWEFEKDGISLDIKVEGPLITNDPEIGLQAAVDGLGIAYLFDHMTRDLRDQGRLIPLLEDWSPPFEGFYIYYPSPRQMSRPLRAFIDFAKAYLGDRSRPSP